MFEIESLLDKALKEDKGLLEKGLLDKALAGEPYQKIETLDTDNILREEIDVGTYKDLDLTEGLDTQQAIKPVQEEEDVSLRFNAPEHYEPEVDENEEPTGQYIDTRTGEVASDNRMEMTNLFEGVEDEEMEFMSSEAKYGAFGLDKKQTKKAKKK